MIDRRALLTTGVALGALMAASKFSEAETMTTTTQDIDFRKLTDANWRKRLDAQQYDVLRKHGTERPGTSPLNHEKRKGTFACAACDLKVTATIDDGSNAPLATCRCSRPTPNSRAAPVGRASISRCRTRSAPRPTVASSWPAPRCTANAAKVTSAMCSTTARSRPACATA